MYRNTRQRYGYSPSHTYKIDLKILSNVNSAIRVINDTGWLTNQKSSLNRKFVFENVFQN